MSTDLAPTPPATAALSAPMQAALDVLAEGGRIKDAAHAAGPTVTVSQVWAWQRRHPAFRAALDARYAALADAERDVLSVALARATDPEATERDVGNGLRAASMVQGGLGIGPSQVNAHAAGPQVNVTVAVGLLGGAGSPPSVDVPGVVVDASTVEASQPRRSRSSSRRPTRSGSSASD